MAVGTRRPKKHHYGIPAQISGMAGVYYVAYELSRRGYIALPTNRNVAGFDIIASNQKGLRHTTLQVKTLQSKGNYWPINRPVPDYMSTSSRAFYIFARFDKKQERFECFIASGKDVAEQVGGWVRAWYKTHRKTTQPDSWTYGWCLPKGKEKSYLNRWDKLKLDERIYAAGSFSR